MADHNGDDRWITDWPWSDRYPSYTRANAGEVLPEPSSPLNVTLLWDPGVNIGWAEGYTDRKALGTHLESELDPVYPETIGNFAGYHYTNLPGHGHHRRAHARHDGGDLEPPVDRGPGRHPAAPAPGHRREPRDHRPPRRAGRVGAHDHGVPRGREGQGAGSRGAREPPDLSALSDAELVERARAMVPDIAYSYKWHVRPPPSAPVRALPHGRGTCDDRPGRRAGRAVARRGQRRLRGPVVRDVGPRSRGRGLVDAHGPLRGAEPGDPDSAAGQ